MADTPTAPVPGGTESNAQPIAVETTKSAQPNPQDLLARKERQLRKMQQDLHAQRQSLEAQRKQYETDYVPKSRLKEDPWSVLEDTGLDYDTLTQQMLQRPNDPMTKALQARIKALEEQHSKALEAQQQQATAQYEQAKKQIANEVSMLVDSDANFETIKTAGMQEAVVELIEQTFNSTGVLMDVTEAAAKVEDHLINEGLKLARLAKVQAKLKPPEPETPPPVKATAKSPTMTITNRMQPTTPSKSSEKDRIARAIAAFNGSKI